MLTHLSVENYALIESLEMTLSPSLNIITGETGAGKSILLGALGLILGNRADTAALKDHGKNCVIEGTFDISDYGLEQFFEENDLEYESTTVVRRVITPAGKSRAYVNDLPVQLAALKDLTSRLIDIHSQHQSLMAADERFRTNIVDSISEGRASLTQYGALYNAYRRAERELTALRAAAQQNSRDEEYLRFQYDQIAALNLHEGELEELEAEQRELANAGQIQESLAVSSQSLDADEMGILPQLKTIEHNLQSIADVYPRAEELVARVHSVQVELKDVAAELASEADRVESNPLRLEVVEERMNAIYSLLRKHGLTGSDELMGLARELKVKLEVITGGDEAIDALSAEVASLRSKATEVAGKITAARKKAADKLGKEVEMTVERLGMPSSRFICEVTPLGELSSTGADEIRFLFTANKSMAPQPMEKIASGGEISRLMLTLKSLVARHTMLPTIIFDEIDTGVSGRIADAMGEIIAELSSRMQVLNITHLPQVASKGDTHFLVYKDESGQGTLTHIRLLTKEERITEIAKMLSGSRVTDAAVNQAKLLLGE